MKLLETYKLLKTYSWYKKIHIDYDGFICSSPKGRIFVVGEYAVANWPDTGRIHKPRDPNNEVTCSV